MQISGSFNRKKNQKAITLMYLIIVMSQTIVYSYLVGHVTVQKNLNKIHCLQVMHCNCTVCMYYCLLSSHACINSKNKCITAAVVKQAQTMVGFNFDSEQYFSYSSSIQQKTRRLKL
eukprot:TRINITY_DN19859_c0_g2_i1.p1 TRINITY_DN19859_c0_g2~~TRINITY_DN19859_c0_g2_i1.p1  ORF type:complete len:117 (+),score=1.64 TRINITY_DN19859_c0_g2_i1:1112-1462(+)